MIKAYKGKKPKIGRNVFIAPNAVIIGDVEIGDNASIWFSTVIRGDLAPIRIGVNTNIQDNCTLHTDADFPVIIEDNVTIGHNAVVHGCRVEERSLVGINAVVLNGAHIQKGAIVAAGAVVREGQLVASCHLVAGIPAQTKKVLPELPEGETPHPVQDYLDLSAAYQKEGIQHPSQE